MNIVLLDITSNYPINISANNKKAEFIAMGLANNGCQVLIVNSLRGCKHTRELKFGISETGVSYVTFPHASGLKGWISNCKTLARLLKTNKAEGANRAIIGMVYYPIFLFDALLSKYLGYKSVSLFHEWHISFNHRNALHRIESWLKDKTFGYFVNGILPISEFLIRKSKTFKRPMLKLPVLADFQKIPMGAKIQQGHFVYCAHAGYVRIITFILKAYSIAQQHGLSKQLVLVLHGKRHAIDNVRGILKEMQLEENVMIKSELTDRELFNLYQSSVGLLIPLDPENIQDKARFSQKIAEYLTSARPIITTSAGEIPRYFQDKKNAIIANYTPEDFANAMIYLTDNLDRATEIGENGWLLGASEFDCTKNAHNITSFFHELSSK